MSAEDPTRPNERTKVAENLYLCNKNWKYRARESMEERVSFVGSMAMVERGRSAGRRCVPAVRYLLSFASLQGY